MFTTPERPIHGEYSSRVSASLPARNTSHCHARKWRLSVSTKVPSMSQKSTSISFALDTSLLYHGSHVCYSGRTSRRGWQRQTAFSLREASLCHANLIAGEISLKKTAQKST